VNGTDPSGEFCLGLCTITNAAESVYHVAVKAVDDPIGAAAYQRCSSTFG
jgi:hypothetical protein